MNPETAIAGLFALASALLLPKLFANKLKNHLTNTTLTFGLLSSTGVLMGMGTVEMAGRYGYGVIGSLIAFSFIFIFSPLLFFPIRRLNRVSRFATQVDFLTFRFRGQSVASITTICLILTTTPLLIAQIKAIDSASQLIFSPSNATFALPVIILCALAINYETFRSGYTGCLRNTMSTAGILILVTLFLVSAVSIKTVFGGLAEMNDWVKTSGQGAAIARLDSAYLLVAVFLSASLALPGNFYMAISENVTNQQARVTAWAYPLMTLLIAIPVFPLMWSGLALHSTSPLQEYIFALPFQLQQPMIAGFAAASIILVALAFICSITINLSKTILNSFLLPQKPLHRQPYLTRWMNSRLLLISFLLIVPLILLAFYSNSQSITDYYLVGFVGLTQLVPGLLASVYVPKATRRGILSGLVIGVSAWFITLFLPLLFGGWQWQIPGSSTTLNFGMESWGSLALEVTLLNITISTLLSIFHKMSEEEVLFAHLCNADNIYIPARIELEQKTVADIRKSLGKALGQEADIEVNSALQVLDMDAQQAARPASLRLLRDEINSALSLRFGVLAASRIMEEALPLVKTAQKEPDDLYQIESVLSIHGHRLTGIASELNRLRIHHREILDNLPIGIVSVGKDNEILMWNSTMASYSGLSSTFIAGSHLNDLPAPWPQAFQDFLKSNGTIEDNLRLELGNDYRWFNFHKSAASDVADTPEERIILVEETTDSVVLTQNYINRERLASVGRLAAGVAHEIGNPVTGIACLAQDLQHESESPAINESANQILAQTERINRIVQSMIHFSRNDQQAGQEQQAIIALSEVVDEAIQLLLLDKERVKVHFNCSVSDKLKVFGDHHQLIQVFINLLSNAQDASPQGGEVSINATQDSNHIVVNISDEGSGIEDDIEERIFEPFVTSKDPGEGTGLGLWIVFNLVKKLNGEISLSSPAEKSDRGTTASIRLLAAPTET